MLNTQNVQNITYTCDNTAQSHNPTDDRPPLHQSGPSHHHRLTQTARRNKYEQYLRTDWKENPNTEDRGLDTNR